MSGDPHAGMLRRDLVVIGASAGGMEALTTLAADLPADLDAIVVAIVHTSPSATNVLARMLSRAGPLPAETVAHTLPLKPGHVYLPRHDRHLLIGHGDRALVVRGPRENRARPAIDPLFRSAARWCGPRVIGVVLSGALDDGAAGAAAIADCGGTVLVQSPEEAPFRGMPTATLNAVPSAKNFPVTQLGGVIGDLVAAPVEQPEGALDADLIAETAMSENGGWNNISESRPGLPTGLGCPECSGGLHVVGTVGSVHYRCHVKHAFSPETLAAAKSDDIESALWTAVSSLQEQALLHRQMAATAAEQNRPRAEREHLATAERAVGTATVIAERILGDGDGP